MNENYFGNIFLTILKSFIGSSLEKASRSPKYRSADPKNESDVYQKYTPAITNTGIDKSLMLVRSFKSVDFV
jgi:hypothetical protein